MAKSSETIPLTFIEKGTRSEADIHSATDMKVAGILEGKITVDKKFILTKTGELKGKVTAPNADVEGKITGELLVSDKLILRSTSVIEGKIMASTLIVEDGAQLKSTFKVGPDISFNGNGKTSNKSQQSPKKN